MVLYDQAFVKSTIIFNYIFLPGIPFFAMHLLRIALDITHVQFRRSQMIQIFFTALALFRENPQRKFLKAPKRRQFLDSYIT